MSESDSERLARQEEQQKHQDEKIHALEQQLQRLKYGGWVLLTLVFGGLVTALLRAWGKL